MNLFLFPVMSHHGFGKGFFSSLEQLQEAKLRAMVMTTQLHTLRLMQSCGTSDTSFSVPSWSQAVI